MKRLRITETAKIEAGTFHEGETRLVEEAVAGLLVGNGWARELDVTLEIDSPKLGVTAEHVDG